VVAKPDLPDLIVWLGLQSPPNEDAQARYTECLDTAVDEIERRCNLPDDTTDDDYPQPLRTAELLLAARLAKRSTSPEGVAGMSELGAVVRVLSQDPDVERLIRRFLKLDGFA
jgi:hypothetical protein